MGYIARLVFASAIGLVPTLTWAQTNLIFNSYLPRYDELYQTAIRGFAEAIEKESGGSITVTIPDTTLAPSDRQYEMVRDGIADMAIVSSGAVRQLVVLNQIADLPLHSPTSRASSIALWETYNRYFLPLNEFKGVKVLSTSVLPGRQVLSVSDKSFGLIEDFSGIKLWSPPGRLTGVAKMLGSVPVNSEFTDLHEYVTKGTVDAVIMTPGSADSAKILDSVKSITQIPGGLGSLSFSVFISEERWNELDAEQQAAVLRAAEGLPERSGAAADAAEAELKDKIAAISVTRVEGEAFAPFEERFASATDDWKAAAAKAGLANPDEVVDFYRSVLEREAAKAP